MLIEEALAFGGTAKTWYPIIAPPFALKFVVVSEFFVCQRVSTRSLEGRD